MMNRSKWRFVSKHFAPVVTLGIGLAVAAGAANAQYRDSNYPGPNYPQDRSGQGRSYRQDSLFDRVQRHLDRAASNSYQNSGSRRRLDSARREIWDFQRRWSEGRFDKCQLDQAIGSVHRVVESDGLDYRDRRVLQDDVMQMRAFRANRGYLNNGYSGRDYPDRGYRDRDGRNGDYGYR